MTAGAASILTTGTREALSAEVDNTAADLLPELVPGYSGLPHATVVDFGGEDALLRGVEPGEMLAGTVALCAVWSNLSDTAAAVAFVEDAVALLDASELIPFVDVVLATPAALPALAPGLARAWSQLASNDLTLLGNIAIEGWTRLALGGWCSATLPIRAALATRGAGVTEGVVAADQFLVRSIAAAADAWAEPELVATLEKLTEVEDVETDAAFELGMLHLRDAVQATDLQDALSELCAAMRDYERACIEGDRPDAVAFRAACEAVHAFATGRSVSWESVGIVDNAAGAWLRGYLGDAHHWRQSRGDVAPQWAGLIRNLHAVADLNEPAWYDTAALLADAGRLYVSYNATTLVASPAAADETAPATPVFLGPRLDAGLAATADKLRLVDRWLASESERADSDVAVTAIREARERIRAPALPTPSGKAHASRDGIPINVREALENHLDTSGFHAFERAAQPLITPGKPASILIQRIRNRILGELQEIYPEGYPAWATHLAGIVETFVHCVAHTIDRQQGGARNLPWHNVIAKGERPAEHYLADHLAIWFEANHYTVATEGANIAGGRADVAIWDGAERFVIEVKQIAVGRTNHDLSDDYGPQAQQYTMTAAPFAFLAVLDNVPRTSRIDLDSSVWTSPWKSAETGATHALTAARIIADAQPPSAQPSVRKRAEKKCAETKRAPQEEATSK